MTLATNQKPLPKVQIPTMFRLGIFNMGLGLMAVLTFAVLNRIMISELAIPASITAGIVAIPQFIAPVRIWFGQLSDTKTIFKLHRSGYVWIGTLLFGICIFLAVQGVWLLGIIVRDNNGWLWNYQTIMIVILLGIILAGYGLALSCSSTPFTALLVDISDEDNRSKIVSIVWSMLMVGIVIGGITGSIFLKKVEQTGTVLGSNLGSILLTGDKVIATPIETLKAPINQLFLIVPLIVFVLALVAIFGIEKKYSRFSSRVNNIEREDSITLSRALRILTASRQTAIFFVFLLIFTISLFMQEAVLEPYGGDVFGMSIGETTLLNSFWGIGILIGYSITGFLIIPRLGQKLTTKIGCLLVSISFVFIIISGFTQKVILLKIALLIFGAATGVGTIGGISLMLDLTAAETAGTFIGAWGLAQAIARAFATFFGGVVLDIGKVLFTTPVLAYSVVFAMQSVGMLLAIMILNEVDVKEFQENTKRAIATVMEGDLE
jgi:MFS transporter, BCD family, chlorophyll transporter